VRCVLVAQTHTRQLNATAQYAVIDALAAEIDASAGACGDLGQVLAVACSDVQMQHAMHVTCKALAYLQ
jgi:hypothetical protein